MPKNLHQVNYSKFRNAIQTKAAQKVKNKGKTTYLYDQHNRIIAALKSASMDTFGRTRPAEYYVSAA